MTTLSEKRYSTFRNRGCIPFLAMAVLLVLVGGVGWRQPTSLADQGSLGDPVGLTASSGPGIGQVSLRWTVVKMVDFSYKPSSAIPADAV